MKMKSIKYLNLIAVCFLLLLVGGCRKFVEVELPGNQLNTDVVFRDSITATAAITGIYFDQMLTQSLSSKIGLFTAMCADQVYTTNVNIVPDFMDNEIQVTNGDVENMWSNCYSAIYRANDAIEKIPAVGQMSPVAKNQLIGEAKFIRAFFYFYLSNLWGDIPLILTADYRKNMSVGKTPKAEVTAQMIKDLTEAKELLSTNFIDTERTRPNRFAAAALLARVYLYNEDWVNAEKEATFLIGSGNYTPLPSLANTFLKTSKETILQLKAVNPNLNAQDGSNYVPGSSAIIPTYLATPSLFGALANDPRRVSWISNNTIGGTPHYYPYKYKLRNGSSSVAPTEYQVMFRLAEQYLIRAEARAKQNINLTSAVEDLNVLRVRAGVGNLDLTLSQSEIIVAVERERNDELFTEWGHRWFDLKRTGRANAILGDLKGDNWQSTDVLWPIPNSQVLMNTALAQNPGYDK